MANLNKLDSRGKRLIPRSSHHGSGNNVRSPPHGAMTVIGGLPETFPESQKVGGVGMKWDAKPALTRKAKRPLAPFTPHHPSAFLFWLELFHMTFLRDIDSAVA